MAEGTAEQPQQQNPDQVRDERIPKVIDELSKSARLMTDSRSLSLSSTSEKRPRYIEYSYYQRDRARYVELGLENYNYDPEERGKPDILPQQLKDYERIIPAIFRDHRKQPNTDIEDRKLLKLWIHLDKEQPKVWQAQRDGKLLQGRDSLNRTEEMVETPELLPDILDAVGGEKRVSY